MRSLRSVNRIIFKGSESVLKGLIPVLETVQTRLVLKRPQGVLNRRTLDRYHRALDSWSQRALDRPHAMKRHKFTIPIGTNRDQTCPWIPKMDPGIRSQGSGSGILLDHRSRLPGLSRDPMGSQILAPILSRDSVRS